MSDQPTPTPNSGPHVIDVAIEMLESRRELGRQRYGTPLQTGNGRDFGRDADEEMADWMIYWAGYRIEHARRIQSLLATIGKQSEQIKALRSELEDVAARADKASALLHRGWVREAIDELDRGKSADSSERAVSS